MDFSPCQAKCQLLSPVSTQTTQPELIMNHASPTTGSSKLTEGMSYSEDGINMDILWYFDEFWSSKAWCISGLVIQRYSSRPLSDVLPRRGERRQTRGGSAHLTQTHRGIGLLFNLHLVFGEVKNYEKRCINTTIKGVASFIFRLNYRHLAYFSASDKEKTWKTDGTTGHLCSFLSRGVDDHRRQ